MVINQENNQGVGERRSRDGSDVILSRVVGEARTEKRHFLA